MITPVLASGYARVGESPAGGVGGQIVVVRHGAQRKSISDKGLRVSQWCDRLADSSHFVAMQRTCQEGFMDIWIDLSG